MTTAPVTVTLTTPASELLSLFDRYDYNSFPVLGPEGRLAGIVTKLDLLRVLINAAAKRRTLKQVSAGDIMQRKVVSIKAEQSILDVGKLMLVTKLRSVPVAQGRGSRRKLLGMLSRGDVLRGLRHERE